MDWTMTLLRIQESAADPPASADVALIRDIRGAFGGDEALRRRLAAHLLRMLPPMIQRIQGRTGPMWADADTEDLLQGFLIELFRRDGHILRQIDPARGTVRAFLYRVLARWLYRRRSPPVKVLHEHADREDEHDFADEVERMLCLEKVLATLTASFSARDEQLFRRVFVEETEVKTVAAEMHMTVDAVHQWSTRIRQRAEAIARKVGCHRDDT